MLEVGYQISQNFEQTADLDRVEWFEYITDRISFDELIDCIDAFLLDQWWVHLDQAVILECAYQSTSHLATTDAPISRQMFGYWCSSTRKTRNDLIQLITFPPFNKRVH